MIYASYQDGETVELYVSESGKPAPAGFVACTLAAFLEAWALRDRLRMARMRAALEQAQ